MGDSVSELFKRKYENDKKSEYYKRKYEDDKKRNISSCDDMSDEIESLINQLNEYTKEKWNKNEIIILDLLHRLNAITKKYEMVKTYLLTNHRYDYNNKKEDDIYNNII